MKLPAANPPPGTPYADIDDWRNRALLESNGIDLSEAALVGALTSRDEQLRPVAAAALGVVGGNAAIAPLTAAARSGDDHLAAAAAAALARLGDAHGIEILRDLVQRPVSTSVVPLAAAGALARCDVPDGYPAVRAGLAAGNFLVRIAAAKQLYFFVPLRGRECPDGSRVDAFDGYRQALADANDDVRWAALFQLQFLTDAAVPLLEDFLAGTPTDWLAAEARRMLAEQRS